MGVAVVNGSQAAPSPMSSRGSLLHAVQAHRELVQGRDRWGTDAEVRDQRVRTASELRRCDACVIHRPNLQGVCQHPLSGMLLSDSQTATRFPVDVDVFVLVGSSECWRQP